jgi:hypothetical protein
MQRARIHYSRYPESMPGKLARQLGYFSIALGAAELLMARRLTRALGMQGQERLVRAYGVREIVSGIGILTSPNPAPWVWGRVGGDAIDLGTMAMAYPSSDRPKTLAFAIANVAMVTALDVMCAQQLSTIATRQQLPSRDYSDRSGLPLGLEASRGVAKDAMEGAPEYRQPAALEPYDSVVSSQ